MREGVIIGRSRLLLMAGLLGMVISLYLNNSTLSWVSTAVVALAFTINSYVKVTNYWGLPIPREGRVLLVTSWLLLSVFVIGIFIDYFYALYTSGYGGFFWALVGGSIGLALFYRYTQSLYLSGLKTDEEDMDIN